jgi:Domain of unknown function (DUF4157)
MERDFKNIEPRRNEEASEEIGAPERRQPPEGIWRHYALQRQSSDTVSQLLSGDNDRSPWAAAERGTSGTAGPLPHLSTIQAAFGKHDVTRAQAYTDDAAREGAASLGAQAFAVGERVAFGGEPTLHTAAHEAAHIVQQRGGVQLKDGLGQSGDPYEQHADAVADLVVGGRSAEHLLDAMAPAAAPAHGRTIQRLTIHWPSETITEATIPRNAMTERGVHGVGVPGDHTTAHVVLRDWIANNLAGVQLGNVTTRLNGLLNQVFTLPYMQAAQPGSGNVPTAADEAEDLGDADLKGTSTNMKVTSAAATNVEDANAAAGTAIDNWETDYKTYDNTGAAARPPLQPNLYNRLMAACRALLDLRNSVPLSSVADGRVGNGEHKFAGTLRTLEATPATAITKANLFTACIELFDSARAAEAIGGTTTAVMDSDGKAADAEVQKAMLAEDKINTVRDLPGLTLNYDRDVDNLAEHHILNIQQAYPRVWANKFTPALRTELKAELVLVIKKGGGMRKDGDFKMSKSKA